MRHYSVYYFKSSKMKTHKEVKSTAKGKDFGVGSPRAARVNTNLNSPRIKVPVSPKDVQSPKTGAYMNSKLTSPKVDNPQRITESDISTQDHFTKPLTFPTNQEQPSEKMGTISTAGHRQIPKP